MSEINEQRVCIKFCLKLGKNASETYTMIKTAFGDDSLSRSVTFEWLKHFEDSRQSIKDDPRSGRPSTSRNDDVVANIYEKLRNDRRLTVRELANEAGISIGSCHEILTEKLQMRRVAAKFVPRLLISEQNENRLTICQDLKNRSADINCIKNIVTWDETWVYGYDLETKLQSSQWKTKFSPLPKKARQVRSNVKTMLIVFSDIEGMNLCLMDKQSIRYSIKMYNTFARENSQKAPRKLAKWNLVSSSRQCASTFSIVNS
ncbi:hypothetical protein AGLY_015254 [Aphis glycines]|uniref:Mos1 transposase HTH domain-containing protein n=1 Tax=Aphis glycines TaxID=307491 RepID=A0A6G0T1I9_APHGL|nr:hypothetical protein AGLY_015254 [Aphis glycines]